MIKRLIQITVLVFLAWYLQMILEVILPFPSESLFQKWLESDSETIASIAKIALKLSRYAVWMLFIGILIKYTGPILGFLLPFGKRLSTTKLMRRVQGFYTELFVMAIITVALGAVFILNPSISAYNKAIEEQKAIETEKYYDDIIRVRTSLADELKDNRYKAQNFIIGHKDDFVVPDNIWPLGDNTDIEDYSSDKELGGLWATIKGSVKRLFKDTSTDIRTAPEYKTYFKNQKSLKRRLANAKAQRIDKLDILKKAKTNVKAMMGNPVQNTLLRFRSALVWILPLSLAVYFVMRLFVKRARFGRVYDKILHFFHKTRFGSGGSARFAGMVEEWPHLYENQKAGLYMGRSMYNPLNEIGLEDPRHMTTFAMTRGEKGSTVIIPNLLSWQSSVLVIDPKGTNARVTANARQRMGHRVHVIDPFGETGMKSSKFNVLDTLDPKSPSVREEILVIAEALVERPKDEREPFWNNSAEQIIGGLIAHLITSPDYKKPHLGMLRDMISQSQKDQLELWTKMCLNKECGNLASDAGFRIANGIGTDEITNILSNVSLHTAWLSSPTIQGVIKKSSFMLDDLKCVPTSVYLVLPPDKLKTHNRFLRLFINTVITEMSRGGRSKTTVLMMLDEFLALGRLKKIEEAFPLMAGYNFILWPFITNLKGLEGLYGQESADAFLSGSRAIQVFSIDGGSTKQFVSDYLGKAQSKMDKSQSVPLREPTEVATEISVESGLQYILRAGKPPMILERVPYYKSAPYKLLAKLPWYRIPMGRFGKYLKGRFDGLYDPDPDYS